MTHFALNAPDFQGAGRRTIVVRADDELAARISAELKDPRFPWRDPDFASCMPLIKDEGKLQTCLALDIE